MSRYLDNKYDHSTDAIKKANDKWLNRDQKYKPRSPTGLHHLFSDQKINRSKKRDI